MTEKKRADFECGDLVRIIKTDKTKERYGVNNSMKRMMTSLKSYEVSSASGSCIRVNGFMWDSSDLLNITTYKDETKENIFNFDVSVLDTRKGENEQTERIGASK